MKKKCLGLCKLFIDGQELTPVKEKRIKFVGDNFLKRIIMFIFKRNDIV